MTRQVSECRPARWIMMVLALMTGATAHATQDIQYSGTLIDTPPCTINDGQLIEIDFGEMAINKVAEGGPEAIMNLYTQLAYFDVNCEAATRLFVRYIGNPTSFDNASVQSSIPDLGVQMQGGGIVGAESGGWPGGVPIPIGEGYLMPVDVTTYAFTATPVKKPGVKLPGGTFEATAGLQLEYP